ncbi:CBS domain-containing protein [Duganella sp. FT80W]|uniref:CBS domain-containing protein n=1 Tax=Duganella guangzhouensis TaxID=2666084 RepID=A0A6I2LB99_9BURK|nr:CBS domain-containing protein [Duganella guangzhouensis]MRW94397.1 CBS domain-containing protein [Duganella guangzhouensis]
MLVKDIMSRDVVTVGLDDTLALVKEIFDHSKFHHLLALEKGELLGVVSDRDLFKALSPNLGTNVETYKDAATLNKRVHQIMSRKPKILRDDATVDDAIDLFNQHAVSCIPILSQDDRLVGILSWRDILRNLRPQP